MKVSRSTHITISGASSGIGRALTELCLEKGAHVLALARNAAALEQLKADTADKKGILETRVCDVREEAQCRAALDQVDFKICERYILVNNAGVGHYASIRQLKGADLDQVLKTNLYGPLWLSQTFLEQIEGSPTKPYKIVNVSSIIGSRSVPYMGAYCMSKFALNALDEALGIEQPRGRVLLVSPGLTQTNFQSSAQKVDFSPPISNQRGGMNPEKVAQRMVCAIEKDRRRIYLTVGGKVLLVLQRLSPGVTDALLRIFFRWRYRKNADHT